MSALRLFVLIFVVLQLCGHQVQAAAPSRFLNFLQNNKADTGLPLSYNVPANYWKNVPPINTVTQPEFQAVCGRVSTVDELNKYTAQTEQFLTTTGLNLYDGAVRQIGLAILGHADAAQQYEQGVLVAGHTFQLANIRGSTACAGIQYYGQCNDTKQTGSCGFCYGGNDARHVGVSADNTHAYFFRMIGDVYAFGGTVDQRCPEKNLPWTWNDWRPVAGENAWANFIGPLQTAYLKANRNVNSIADDSSAMKLATAMFATFKTMQMPNGAIAYAPYNTYDSANPALGGTASTENAASSLAGLRILLQVIQNKQSSQYKSLVNDLQDVISKLTGFIKSAYSPSLGYFRQGGTYNKNGGFDWNESGDSGFAVDCQTWVMTVIGANTVDSWFGTGASHSIWLLTKRVGGFGYNAVTNKTIGLGFSQNQKVQVFSGEWSFGGVNMLRVFAKQIPSRAQEYNNEADDLREAIEDYLTFHDNGINSDVVNYANKRYYIPWGWWANPISSTASISWAVMVDSNYNPFVLGGAYA